MDWGGGLNRGYSGGWRDWDEVGEGPWEKWVDEGLGGAPCGLVSALAWSLLMTSGVGCGGVECGGVSPQ